MSEPADSGRLVLASRNPHKLREMSEILDDFDLVELPAWIELPPEAGETFESNALTKARTAARATGQAAIADDSGITATALGGRPGVRSARFAGPSASDDENLDRLLTELGGEADRSVAYVCAIAWVGDEGAERTFTARCEGTLIGERRGRGGFGYDPCFVPVETGEEDQRTMAELSPAEKHAISHRGTATRMLAGYLHGAGPEPGR